MGKADRILKGPPPTYDLLHENGLGVVLGLTGAGCVHSLHTHKDLCIRGQTRDGELGLINQIRVCNYPFLS